MAPASSPSTVFDTFLGALQGTISVLLTCFAGYTASRHRLLTRQTVKHISTLCTTLFLPALLIVQMGPELTPPSLSRYWIIPAWGLASTIVGHLVGWAGQRVLGLKHWTIIACGRPNSNALPLLLLQSFESTGVLELLARDGDTVKQTLHRGRSLLLLNAIVQQVFTLQLAPSVLARDDGHHKADRQRSNILRPGPGRLLPIVQDEERVGLLDDPDTEAEQRPEVLGDALDPIVDAPDVHWPQSIAAFEKPVKKVWSYMSPPLIGAIIAFAFGMIGPLHRWFLDEDGVLYASVTQSVKNLGDIFVVLQTFSVGAELALVPSSHPGYLPTVWVLVVRFALMPALSLLFVWLTAGRGWYVSDPLVWFLLVLLPAGPSAMLLVNVAELVDIDQGPIAGYLTIAYFLSPLMAVVCSLGLAVVQRAQERV
ncbi:predicted protein [Postia placenta Mad-698-R]|uniref:Auxin efflux carrier n=1 Tax=Postia placenta MAD-698-R-SB12 TaxID=670580 RepID=A0A1X6NCM3_9APHY|nr:hypothetical protein POSPLADRAFT_1043622 [Postia placenta MAD-698-R-SB12]EED78394.1 predicted protein [Postia placenta Mad-698-R]OSX66133.1 hypothetical protein POSPLADRAFT_1043622 [Postia placenta MAD-698-R-SB12]